MKILACVMLSAFALAATAAGEKASWSYEGKTGAKAWGDLDPGFATCKLGKQQSPIDIRAADAKKVTLPPTRFGYAPAAAEVVNNGHTIQVEIPTGGTIGIADGEYKLVQFHFHAPSEEKIDGKPYPLVAHLVHQNAEGKLAAIAVLFREGRENEALKPLFASLPAKPGDKRALKELDLTKLLPADRAAWRFAGSLTTPPCSEEVRWQVLKQPVEISKQQLDAFRKLYPMNARPVQPLNGRVVEQG